MDKKLLKNSVIRNNTWIIDDLTQAIQHLFPVVVESAIDFIDRLLLDYVQITFRFTD